MKILEIQNLSKTYGKGDVMVRALNNVSFSVEKGEFVAIVGPRVLASLHCFISWEVLIHLLPAPLSSIRRIFHLLMKLRLLYSDADR